MPKIRWTDGTPSMVRVVGPYQWHKRNGFVCEVAAEDVPGIVTSQGFELAEDDDLTAIKGIGQTWADELTLVGIVTFRQLAEADESTLADRIGARRAMVRAWQERARTMLNDRHVVDVADNDVADDVDDIQAEEAPRG